MSWTRNEAASTPALVVCPMLLGDAGMDVAAAQEIYRLAYESARAALRPSTYEVASRPCWN